MPSQNVTATVTGGVSNSPSADFNSYTITFPAQPQTSGTGVFPQELWARRLIYGSMQRVTNPDATMVETLNFTTRRDNLGWWGYPQTWFPWPSSFGWLGWPEGSVAARIFGSGPPNVPFHDAFTFSVDSTKGMTEGAPVIIGDQGYIVVAVNSETMVTVRRVPQTEGSRRA